MTNIVLVDPQGIKRLVPFNDLSAALEAGASFGSEEEKQKAIAYNEINKRFPKMPKGLKDSLFRFSSAFGNEGLPDAVKQAASNAEMINKGVESTGLPQIAAVPASGALGVAQGLGDAAASVLNTPEYLANLKGNHLYERFKFPDLSKSAGDSTLSRVAFTGGRIVSPLAIPGGASAAAETVFGKLGAGALGGFLTGEDESGSRGLSTLIGAAVPGIAETIKQVKSGTYRGIGKDIVKAKKNITQEYNKKYADWFGELQERGAHDAIMPPSDVQLPTSAGFFDKETKEALSKYAKSPTISAAHELQSDLGKLSAQIKKRANTFVERQAAQEIGKAQKQLRAEMMKELSRLGHTDLALDYGDITQGFKQDVTPYLRIAVDRIEKSIKAGASPKNAVKELMKDEKFLSAAKGSHKGFEDRKAFNETMEILKSLGVPILSAFGIGKLFGL